MNVHWVSVNDMIAVRDGWGSSSTLTIECCAFKQMLVACKSV